MRAAPVQRNRAIRENCLVGTLNAGDALKRDIGELARLLRVLSGMYDQAMRSDALRSFFWSKKAVALICKALVAIN